jgi:hypothetical protein
LIDERVAPLLNTEWQKSTISKSPWNPVAPDRPGALFLLRKFRFFPLYLLYMDALSPRWVPFQVPAPENYYYLLLITGFLGLFHIKEVEFKNP